VSATHCPHKLPKRSWSFSAQEVRPQDAYFERIFVTNASACPSCLQDRVTNLREACQRLRHALKMPRDLTPEERRDVEMGLRLFYDDLAREP
jgi:hypothetical protein